MKNLKRIYLIILFFCPIILWANVVVKGHVTNSASSKPAPNYEVHILSDSADRGCLAMHVKQTNPNGIYQDTLVCNGVIKHVTVWIKDCDGNNIYQYLPVPTSGVVEANFTACLSDGCHARFSYYLVTTQPDTTGYYIHFRNSESIVAPGESIVTSFWSFGDGTTLAGNISNPDHVYLKPGSYNVCLKIISSSGCTDSICKAIIIVAPIHCKALFSWEATTTSTNVATAVRFQSNSSKPLPNDSIIARRWVFGDGIMLEGNTIYPTHIYQKGGKYTVCLFIKTAGGCSDSICMQITVPPPPVPCFAYFNASDTGLIGHFFSAYSKTNPNDSIITRKWTFGDGQTLVGNVVSPIHHYVVGGTYNVCLKIISSSGCTDSICKAIIIVAPIHCKALFSWEATTTSTNVATAVRFQSNSSKPLPNDSIIARRWVFGDGIMLEGNTIYPTHIYQKGGKYTVCLFIKTAGGCSDSICMQITVPPPPVPCFAYFNASDTGLIGHFFSAYSKTNPNDSIITRNWTFGDGQTLVGNVISPIHHYVVGGTYNVCLEIHTRLGCENRFCKTIQIVGDSLHHDFIRLINVYPNPATTKFDAITWSMYNNVDATLAIYDVYGVLKISQKTVLMQGNNTMTVYISQLATGPYIFRVTTMYGVVSRTFFKL